MNIKFKWNLIDCFSSDLNDIVKMVKFGKCGVKVK